MKSNPSFAADYKQLMDKMISEGDAELVPKEEQDASTLGSGWIIPHQGVYHKKKNKLRVVFDCAARYHGTCLNDHLLQGPDLLNNLLGCLIRFRQGTIAVAGDIEKMLYRFKVAPGDRKFLRFLWWSGDLDKEPELDQMTVHLFGAASSPGCANFALKKLVADYQEFHDDVCNFVRDNFDVDDGCVNIDEAIRLVENARKLCQKANIRLHKFISNSKPVMETIPVSERTCKVSATELPTDTIERILGVQWNIVNDSFQFYVSLCHKPMTRRGILSTVASVYDPGINLVYLCCSHVAMHVNCIKWKLCKVCLTLNL